MRRQAGRQASQLALFQGCYRRPVGSRVRGESRDWTTSLPYSNIWTRQTTKGNYRQLQRLQSITSNDSSFDSFCVCFAYLIIMLSDLLQIYGNITDDEPAYKYQCGPVHVL